MRKNVESILRAVRLPAVVVGALALVACGRSTNPGGFASRSANEAVAIDTVTATDTVKEIDYANRTMTLQSPDGSVETYRIGPEMTNFNQIHVGDKVRATVAESLAVGIRKAGTPASAGEAVAVALAPKGAKPGMFVTRTSELTAKVMRVDDANRMITLAVPTGGTRTIRLAPNVDVSNYKNGDDVVVRLTDAFALSVERP
jgi:hypothetical protein